MRGGGKAPTREILQRTSDLMQQGACGIVYGHTGNTSGYTQFMAASPAGRASVTVSISEQATNKSKSEVLRTVFAHLRTLESDTVCLALR